ncbi:SDR family oxidoreductase [Parahaliea mediterranea]|uniref:SDR family oxidoreductase n=1 Tax=Parahaliea mediterranea TaxID=651086 RepID=A0A939IPE1_9GAMM|nr:glucose 1-dehydrogenase [Parahaliea mediterranea]MBN7799068.1 SDR family oxidoreductase [Parahaliea mediterranea]
MTRNGRVQGKSALVTGAAAGLGYAMAKRLAEEGASVIITDIQTDLGKEAADRLGIEFIRQDVTSEEDWRTVTDQVIHRHGQLDVLVNNAGYGGDATQNSPASTTVEEWRKLQKINAESVFLGCRHAIESMSPGGAIVNLSSLAALMATPFLTAYGASKAAVTHLTQSVALHCARSGTGIRCNSVHPGNIDTAMLAAGIEQMARASGQQPEAVREQFLGRIPLGYFGDPEDIAHMVLFLASDESRYITGNQFVVDGGIHLNG